MVNGGRWSTALLALVVAGNIAVWPWGDPNGAHRPPLSPGSSPPAPPSEEDAHLARLRQRAALRPCPHPGQDSGRPSGRAHRACLDAPGVVDLGPTLADRAMLLNLWASWCGPRREEMPALAAYAARPDAIPRTWRQRQGTGLRRAGVHGRDRRASSVPV